MYGILELHSKSLDELSTIARELGIKKAESMSKEDLVYKILDEQAVQSDEAAGFPKLLREMLRRRERRPERCLLCGKPRIRPRKRLLPVRLR